MDNTIKTTCHLKLSQYVKMLHVVLKKIPCSLKVSLLPGFFLSNSFSSARPRKFKPNVEKNEAAKEIKSSLTIELSEEDHQAVYNCRSFADATMPAPEESSKKVFFNVTCKLNICHNKLV